jgi:hypothetical protein
MKLIEKKKLSYINLWDGWNQFQAKIWRHLYKNHPKLKSIDSHLLKSLFHIRGWENIIENIFQNFLIESTSFFHKERFYQLTHFLEVIRSLSLSFGAISCGVYYCHLPKAIPFLNFKTQTQSIPSNANAPLNENDHQQMSIANHPLKQSLYRKFRKTYILSMIMILTTQVSWNIKTKVMNPWIEVRESIDNISTIDWSKIEDQWREISVKMTHLISTFQKIAPLIQILNEQEFAFLPFHDHHFIEFEHPKILSFINGHMNSSLSLETLIKLEQFMIEIDHLQERIDIFYAKLEIITETVDIDFQSLIDLISDFKNLIDSF